MTLSNLFGMNWMLLAQTELFEDQTFTGEQEVFGHLEFKMTSLVEKVKLLDEKQQQQSISWAGRIERLEVKKELSVVRRSIDIC